MPFKYHSTAASPPNFVSTAIVPLPSTSSNNANKSADSNSDGGGGVVAAAKSTKMENLVKNIRQRQNMRYITPPSVPPRVASASVMSNGYINGGFDNNWSCLNAVNKINNPDFIKFVVLNQMHDGELIDFVYCANITHGFSF